MDNLTKERKAGQSRKASLYETSMNVGIGVVVGFTVSFLMGTFYLEAPVEKSAAAGGITSFIMTVASFARIYPVRRLFNFLYVKGILR